MTKKNTKKKPTSATPPLALPSPLAPPVPVVPSVQVQLEKLLSAQEIESAVGLKKPALYRLARRRRVVVYRTGQRGGLRFLLSEVMHAIRQPMQVEPTTTGGGSHD